MMPADIVRIPRSDVYDAPGPCWVPAAGSRPRIVCKCGKVCVISLHHVHADGRVTASFYDSKEPFFMHNGKKYGHMPGCGWHAYLILDNYDQGEWVPEDAVSIETGGGV